MKNVIHLSVEYDADSECPNDAESEWRYVSFDRDGEGSIDDYFNEYAEIRGYYPKIGIMNKMRVGTAFMVHAFTHSGQSSYSLNEYNDDRPSSCGGILLWEHPLDDMGAKTLSDRAKDARSFLKRYTDWANGNAFWYSICNSDGDPIDSCGGFLGEDSTEMVKGYISPAIREYMEENNLSTYEEMNQQEFSYRIKEVVENPDTLYILIEGDARNLMCYETLDLTVREAVAA